MCILGWFVEFWIVLALFGWFFIICIHILLSTELNLINRDRQKSISDSLRMGRVIVFFSELILQLKSELYRRDRCMQNAEFYSIYIIRAKPGNSS